MENVLPRKIRCLRKQAGLTQEDVAKRLDIRRQTYCNYENGSRSLPIETIVLLSDYFHVSCKSDNFYYSDIALKQYHR